MIIPSGALGRSRLARVVAVAATCGLACFGLASTAAAQTVKPEPGGSPQTAHVWVKANAVGGLDCNGMSPVQTTVNTYVHLDDEEMSQKWRTYQEEKSRDRRSLAQTALT